MTRIEVLHWTPSHYLTDYKTSRLDLFEHGAYMILLWHMWLDSDSQCEFPYDFLALASIWGVGAEEAERLANVLTQDGVGVVRVRVKKSGRYLFSKRLSEQVKAAAGSRRKKSEAGKESGRVRRQNALNIRLTDVHHPANTSELTVVPSLGSPGLPVDPSKTPSLTPPKTGDSIKPEADHLTAMFAFEDSVSGRKIVADETRSVKRWVKAYGLGMTKDAIGEAVMQGHAGDLDYIGGCLKRWTKGATS